MLKHSITITNATSATLQLGIPHASCSCVVIGEVPRRLGPGQHGTIPIEFYTGGFTGPLHETLTINTPDSAQVLATVELKARVWLPIEASPQFLVLERPGTNATPTRTYARTVHLTNQVDTPVELGKPVGESKSFAAELMVKKPGREFELTIRPVPPLSTGNIYGRFILKTSLKEMPEVEVTAYIPALGLPPPKVSPP